MNVKSLFHFVFIEVLLFHNPLPAQQVNVDSLKSLLNITEGDARISIYINLMKLLQRSDPQTAVSLGSDALTYLKDYSNVEKWIEVTYLKGWAFTFLNKPDSAKSYAEQVKVISQKNNIKNGFALYTHLKSRILRNEGKFKEAADNLMRIIKDFDFEEDLLLKAKILNELGSVERRLGNLKNALQLHLQALEILKNIGEEEDELTITYSFLGISNDIIGNYDDALGYHQKALELNKKTSDKHGIAAALHNIGILYQKTGKFDLALDYFHKAMVYWKELGEDDPLASTLNSIGGINESQNHFQQALRYYKEALAIWEKLNDDFGIAIALNNIGSVHVSLKEYTQALKYLDRSMKLTKELGDKKGLTSTLLILADVYEKTGDMELAIKTGKEALLMAKEVESWPEIKSSHLTLSEIYEQNGLFKEALDEYKYYKAAHDTMFNSESDKIIAELETKYKTDEQSRKIELLQRNTEIQNLYRTLLIAGLVLTTIIILLLYNRYRLKKQAHDTLQKYHESEIEAAEAKSELLQIEYEQKKKELEAARELQLSMLPKRIPYHDKFEIATLMQTASEVGGDYYDFYEGPGDKLTIVIGDATGHGAKASMLVAATKGLFNLLSKEDDIANILNQMNCSIRKMNLQNLFMAMGIVRLNDDIMELAGAGMPAALILREKTKLVESLPLKGLPLGNSLDLNYSKFSTKLNKGDMVALMSDGFPELFNEGYEMFGYDKVKQLVEEAFDKSPGKIIEKFNDTASEWLNSAKQQDDMTFIVFRKKS